MEYETLLEDVVKYGIEKLNELVPGTDEYKATVESVTKLIDRTIEIQKLNDDYETKRQAGEREERLKQAQLDFERDLKLRQFEADLDIRLRQFEFEKGLKEKQFTTDVSDREFERQFKVMTRAEDKKHRWIETGIAIGSVVIPVAVTIWGTKRSFEFEKEGTITTIMGRGFINKLLPKK